MAKGSRILCVSLPLIGTIAILACMAYISSAGIRVDGKEIDSKYFALIDTSKITTTIGKETYHGLPDSHDHSKQKDVFAIYLWNYCSGTKLKGEFRANYCSGARTPFDQYRLWNTWKIDITKGELEHEGPKKDANKRIEVGVEGITYTPKTIRAVYSAAIAVVVLELIFGFVAIWTRWASFVTAILSFIATATLITGTAFSQVLYSALVGSIRKHDYSSYSRGKLGASYGKSVYAISWLAVVISVATTVCWVFSICCVSTSERKKSGNPNSLGAKLKDLSGGHKYEKMKDGERDGSYMGMQETPSPSYAPYAYKGNGQV